MRFCTPTTHAPQKQAPALKIRCTLPPPSFRSLSLVQFFSNLSRGGIMLHALGLQMRKISNGIYKTTPSSSKIEQDIQKTLNIYLERPTITYQKSVLTVVSTSFIGKSSNERKKLVYSAISGKIREKIDVITLEEGDVIDELRPIVYNKVGCPPDRAIRATPQRHFDSAIFLLNQRQPALACEHLWLCASRCLKSLANKGNMDLRKHKSKSAVVEYLVNKYNNNQFFTTWKLMQTCRSNAYDDEMESWEVHKALMLTIEFCQYIYELNKKSEESGKKVLELETFKYWYNIKNAHSGTRLKDFRQLFTKPPKHGERVEQTRSEIDRNKRLKVDAAVIRIMRANMILSHEKLVAKVTQELRQPFLPDPVIINQRIEKLIENSYLAIDEQDHRMYQYIA